MESLGIENYIEHAYEIKDTSLNLSHRCLTVIPSNLIDLKWIHKLMLNNNKLLLPPDVCEFCELEELILDHNMLTLLPQHIERLQNLKKLICCHNPLGTIMPEIGCLYQLEELWLNACQLMFLPKEIGNLKNLCKFSAKVNKLNSIPDTIGELTKLHWINLSSNFVSELPESFGKLRCLYHVNLSCNKFKAIPKCFFSLPQVIMLDLRKNEIENLSQDFLAALPNLNRLDLRENIIQDVPQSWQNVSHVLTGKNEEDVFSHEEPVCLRRRKSKRYCRQTKQLNCSLTDICKETILCQNDRYTPNYMENRDDEFNPGTIYDMTADINSWGLISNVYADHTHTESDMTNLCMEHYGSVVQREANDDRTIMRTRKQFASTGCLKDIFAIQTEHACNKMVRNTQNFVSILENSEYNPP